MKWNTKVTVGMVVLSIIVIGIAASPYSILITGDGTNSMSPTFGSDVHNVSILDSSAEPQVGDIVAYRDVNGYFQNSDRLVVHRVVAIEEEKNITSSPTAERPFYDAAIETNVEYITKGDNNDSRDPPVRENQIEGVVVWHTDLPF